MKVERDGVGAQLGPSWELQLLLQKLVHFERNSQQLSFFFRSSSLLLASRRRVDGVFFFLGDAKTSFPLVSTEKEKLDPMVKEKEKVSDLSASVWQNSRH